MTKKIAIMGLGNCFESIISNLTDVEITVLCDDANSAAFELAKKLNVECKYVSPDEYNSFFATNNFDLIVLEDYANVLPEETYTHGKFINLHPALLPSFKGKDALQRAFMAGVKVSGVTIHWVTADVDGGKIIAQYPVLIGNLTHFDEFKEEMIKTEKMLYPVVIQKILKDEVFDFNDLISGCKGGSCSSCRNCQ